MRTIYRQGDVLFTKIKSIPAGDRRPRARGVLAFGEATGHSHAVAVEDLADAEVFEINLPNFPSALFLRASRDGIKIVHEEHGMVVLPAGDYEVATQREYSPLAIRNVVD